MLQIFMVKLMGHKLYHEPKLHEVFLQKSYQNQHPRFNPHFSQTLWLQSLETLSNKGLTPLKAMRKNQHPVETLTSQDFDQTKIIAFQAFFVRNAGLQ